MDNDIHYDIHTRCEKCGVPFPVARKEHVDKETGKIIPPYPYCDKCTAEIVCKAVKGK